jgi:hypothetical protein
MKKHLHIFILITIVAFFSCEKTQQIDDMTCQLETIGYTSPTNGVEVKYTITGEGNYFANSFYYLDNGEKITLMNPTVPGEITVFAAQGNAIQCGATGSVKDGLLRISLEVIANDTILAGVDQCAQYLSN